jgi:hypothetical protein
VSAGIPKVSLARSLIGLAAALTLHTFVSSCALNGDFDRVRPELVSDDMHKWVGKEAARSQGIKPSHYPLTDDERTLRDLAYPLIEPPFDHNRWYSVLLEYGVSRSFQPEWDTYNVNAYSEQLSGTAYRSATARYMKINDDIQADLTRIDTFFMLARRVLDIDDKRKKSLAFVTSLPEGEGEARSRIAENALVIAWVQQSLAQRAVSYRIALERLVIETPTPMAVEVERGIAMLKQQIAANHVVEDLRFPKPRRPGPRVALAGSSDLNGN